MTRSAPAILSGSALTSGALQGAFVLLGLDGGKRAPRGCSADDSLMLSLTSLLGLSEPPALTREASGRPVFATESLRHLSISTSTTDGARALVVGAFPDVGVDIEAIAEANGDKHLIHRMLAPGETLSCPACIAATNGSESAQATRLWTRKEAFLKLMGTGLMTDPAQVRVSCCEQAEHHRPSGAIHTARVGRDTGPDLFLSVALPLGSPAPTVRVLPSDEIRCL